MRQAYSETQRNQALAIVCNYGKVTSAALWDVRSTIGSKTLSFATLQCWFLTEQVRILTAQIESSDIALQFDDVELMDTALLDGFWRDDEIAELMDAAKALEGVDMALENEPEGNRLTGVRKMQIKPVLYVEQVATFEQALAATGLTNRADALMEICRKYMEGKHAG